ncbi:hypothetical protein U1Q18_003283 [Sarracenia purpurea var. burkii]
MNNMVIKNSNLRGSSGMRKQANEGEIAVAQSGDSSAALQPTEENEVETWAVEKEGRNDGGETDQVAEGEEENTEIDDAEDDGSVEIKFDKDQNKAVEVDMKTDGERKLQTVVNKMSTGSAHKVLVQMPKQNFDSEMSETTTVEDREVVSSNAREDVGENEEGYEGFLLEAPGEGGDCRKTGSEPYGNKVRSSVNDGKLLEINLSSDGEYCADGVLCEAPILANMKIPTDPMEGKLSSAYQVFDETTHPILVANTESARGINGTPVAVPVCQTVFGKGSFATALPRSWVLEPAKRKRVGF